MAITLGGIMRGAIPRLSQRISDVRETKEAAVLKVGERFAALKDKVNEAELKNRAYMSNVESVASSMGIDKDVVYNVFKVYGGNNKSALNHLNNLHKSYVAKGKQIPTMAVLQTEKMLPAKEDKAILAGMPAGDAEMTTFDKAMSLFKTASPDEVFQEFMRRNPQLDEAQVRQIMKNTVTPGYSPKSIIDPKAFAATMGTMKEEKPLDKYTLAFNRFKTLDETLIKQPQLFDNKNTQFLQDLRQPFDLLRQYIDEGDMAKAEEQYNFIIESGFNNITTSKPAGEGDKPSEKYRIYMELVKKQRPGESEDFYKNKVNELMTSDTMRIGNTAFRVTIENGERVLKEFDVTGSDGVARLSNPKIFQNNQVQIQKGTQNLQKIFALRNILREIPNAFSIEGKIRKGVGGVLDLFGAEDYVKALGADKILMSEQFRISFVSSVKDELFDDPRLSDQDLALVLNYIAILDNPLAGPVLSRAALLGIEKAMLNSMSVRIAQNYPKLVSFHYQVDDAGNTKNSIDFNRDSVASRMMQNLMSAEYGVNYRVEFEKEMQRERETGQTSSRLKLMKESTATNYAMVKNSLASIQAYRIHQNSGSTTPFKYQSENLFNVRNLKEFKDGFISKIPGMKDRVFSIDDHQKRYKKLEAEYKQAQQLRKVRLEN